MNNQVYIVCVTDEFLPTPINTNFASDLSMRYKTQHSSSEKIKQKTKRDD